jgi:hypothetical protein
MSTGIYKEDFVNLYEGLRMSAEMGGSDTQRERERERESKGYIRVPRIEWISKHKLLFSFILWSIETRI